jgi:TIR domain/CYTH domain
MSNTTLALFCSYAHADENLKAELHKHLRPLEVEGRIRLWHDRMIPPGAEWGSHIDVNLRAADLVLILVSPDFLASAYCTGVELAFAMERHSAGEAIVVPVIARPCDWRTAPFAKLQALPKNASPISSWDDQDEALADVTQGIRALAKQWHQPIGIPVSERPSQRGFRSTFQDIDVGVEKEIKFAGVANLQLKFLSVESPSAVIDKLATICRMLDIKMGSQKEKQISDEYFDDRLMSLSESGCSLRRRVEDGQHLVTFKRAHGSSDGFGLQRLEKEVICEDHEFRNLMRDVTRFRSWFQPLLSGLPEVPTGQLQKLLTICNHRTNIRLVTDVASYTFSYDKFYFFDESQGIHSEYFTEIEIELSDSQPDVDEQMVKLADGIGKLFQHTEHKKSKLQRGLDWLKSSHLTADAVCAAALEIINFSELPPEYQKQALQSLSHHAKDVILELRGDDKLPACIATGDGIVLVMDDRPEIVIPVIAELQRRIRTIHNKQYAHARFSFRTGLHSGNVFKFTDVNENLNFAGEAIQIARQTMMFGSEWHILATQQAYKTLVAPTLEKLVSQSRKLRTADDMRIEVFNVHEEHAKDGRNFGNPADPMSR